MTPRELIERLVAFDTTSRNSNLELIGFVADYLSGFGIESRLSHNEERTKANLFATIGPPEPGGVVLSGHTDVVPVDGQDWTSDPFQVIEREGRLYGRGTADMKSFLALALAMVPEILAAGLRTPVHLAFSFDEEVGCLGVPHLLRQIAGELPRPRLVIVGEPTEMRVANAHKGISGFLSEVKGLEAHSSASHRGVNAIMAAARLVSFLEELAAEIAARPPADPRHRDFDPPYTTIGVGTIEGGTALNIIPKTCRFRWEVRPLPGFDVSEVTDRFQAFARDSLLPAMRARHPGASILTTPLAMVPPLAPHDDSPAVALALALTGANRTGAVSFATEGGLYQAAGIPAVICGPGSILQAHEADEYISLEQVAAGEDFLRRLIARLAAGGTVSGRNG